MGSACILRRAAAGDAAFLAWGLDEAAGGLFTTMLGRRANAVLTRLAAQTGHALSFQHAVIAEVGAEAIGFCQGFPFGTPAGTGNFMRAAGFGSLRAGAITLLGRPLFAALDHHVEGEWYLDSVAVRPGSRGTGVGTALFSDAFKRATRSGCRSLTLDVDVRNARARSLYERFGLCIVTTSSPALRLDGVSVHRMAATFP